MPSWNIHTAHVERLLADCQPSELGISDANAFLFGNYVPDIYVGFMVPDASYHIDYCITHLAKVNVIPIPDADCFWDLYIHKRRPTSEMGLSLTLGAWAHLVADQFYNGRFRMFKRTHDTPEGKELRIRKQSDFDLFGHSLDISSHVQVNDGLLEAARTFWGYTIMGEDVVRAVDAADAIVRSNAGPSRGGSYRLLDAAWMNETFEACNSRLKTWLKVFGEFEEGESASAVEMRQAAGLPPVTSDALSCGEEFFTQAAGEL